MKREEEKDPRVKPPSSELAVWSRTEGDKYCMYLAPFINNDSTTISMDDLVLCM